MTIAGWGYDPDDSLVTYPAPLTAPDDTGFQVIFANTAGPRRVRRRAATWPRWRCRARRPA